MATTGRPRNTTIPVDLHGVLNPNDHVAISFRIVSIAMVASTCFFLMESMSVGNHWKTSLNVGALVTLIAAVHYYFYMRWRFGHTDRSCSLLFLHARVLGLVEGQPNC